MREEKTNTLIIETPEGISFSLLLAGPTTRFFAWAIDLACITAVTSTLSALLSTLGLLSRDVAMAIVILMYFSVSISYGILTEWHWRGQTLGKRLFKLRVVDEQGLRLQFSQIVIRNLLRAVDAMPFLYLVGGVSCLVTRRAQRLGDYAANTIVIRSRPSLELDIETIAAGKYNSFRDYPHLVARLRQDVPAQEAAIALQALLRREGLDPDARVALFRDIASHFRSLAAFPEEATFGLTDEQYVRNAVESLFQSRDKTSSQSELTHDRHGDIIL
ncbi:RDD family protein [Candidatus Poribacteria bacterium]|nr:RDD family protein [Candidatus Poribacteria bacterium]